MMSLNQRASSEMRTANLTRPNSLREDTREAILNAATRLFHRYGYRKMTMCDVAEEARLSRPTVYLYFPNKEELALGVIDRLHRHLCAELETLSSGEATPDERLRRMLVTRVLFVYDRMPHDSQSLNELFASIRPALLEHRERWLQVEGEHFARVLEEGRRAGAFTTRDPKADARTVLTATGSLMPFALSPRELGEREELECRINALAELLLRGLLVRN